MIEETERLLTDVDGDALYAKRTGPHGMRVLYVDSEDGEVYVPAAAVDALEAEIKNPGHIDRLLADSRKLNALRAAGVDNWEGYGEAMAAFYAHEDEEG